MLARGNLSDSVDTPTTIDATSHQARHDGDVEKGLLNEDVGARRMLKDKATIVIPLGSSVSTSAIDAAGTISNKAYGENVGVDRLERLYLGRSIFIDLAA
jgi:hypothetical protein